MAGQVSSLMKQKGFVFWLMGLTVVYQLVSQVFMYRALRRESSSAASGATGAGDECGATAAAPASSARCLEVQLFRTWQQAAPVWQSLGEGEGRGGQGLVEDMVPVLSGAWNASVVLAAPPAEKQEGQDPATTTPAEEDGTSQSWSPVTAWAHGLADLQSRLELRMGALPSMHRKREEELSQQLDRRARSIATSLEGAEMTGWGRELGELQKSLEAKQAALPSQRRQRAQNATAEARSANGTGPEGSLLDQIHDLQRELCEDPRHQDQPVCVNLTASAEAGPRRPAGGAPPAAENMSTELSQHAATLSVDLAAIAAKSAAWQHDFEQKVDQAHKEMCEHPQRRHRPDCAKFLASLEELGRRRSNAFHLARAASKAALRANIAGEAKERASALDAKLAKLASDRKVWERELLEKYGISQDGPREGGSATSAPSAPVDDGLRATASTTPPARHRGGQELHWSKVVGWSADKHLRGTAGSSGRAKVGRAALRAARWAGMIPKVACIAPVVSGPALEIQMKYFIDNFHLQSYEGPTQLVFVYHYKDRAATRLVESYADGFHVKGVAARGEGEFPSTAALRFGAWSSDADVIAHWNLREFQHPQRLSLQVRALAHASRPACVLKGGAREEGAGADEATLLGEASWMKEHWHPLLEEQRDVLEVAQARHVVEVDMGLGGAGRHQATGEDSLASLRASMDESFDQLAALLQEV